ncbi:MAG: Gfo/Idh/MocA family oxidoreductase [Promethearchaeota archaeon]
MSGKKTCVIVGFGAHARGSWLRAVQRHPDWELVGIVDTDTELLANVPEMGIGLDEDQAYISIDHCVQFGEKPDLAIVATPIYTHHVLVKETMDHGINVICEKNLASSIYQGRQMVQLALDNPRLCTATGFNYRYATRWWTVKKFFASGVAEEMLGKLSFMRWASAGNWGEKRTGWRRWLQEIYLEDMATHWFDLLRYVTGMDVVQVKCDTFIPRYSEWQGSSTVFANLALAHPDDYNHRHEWVWVQLYGDWQRRGPGIDLFEAFGGKGQAVFTGSWGVEVKRYLDETGRRWEDDGYLPQADVEDLGTNYEGQMVILEMMSRGIDSGGKEQPGNNFVDAFKSFAVSMAAIESSRTGRSVWVPDYWKDLPI